MNLAQSSGESASISQSSSLRWLSCLVLLGGIITGIATAYLVISTYSPLPHWDEWALFDHLASAQGWSLDWLWAQHNEHRIFVPKLFFLLDVGLFHGTQTFLLISIFAIQLLQVALLSWSLWVLGGFRGPVWRIGTGLIALCILCPTQYENLVWGFQLQFVIPAAMATLSILTLLLLCRDPGCGSPRRAWSLLLLSIAAAMLSTWSLANGMLLWPLLAATALLLHARRSIVLSLLVAGCANIGLYFFHYHRPAADSGVLPAARSLVSVLQYVAVYFGSTFVRHSGGAFAVTAGAVGIIVALFFILRTLRQKGNRSLFMVQLSFLMTFCLATAAITSSGRLHLGLEQASASRYQTFALLFWCCLGLAILTTVARTTDSGWLPSFSAVILVMMIGFAPQFRMPLIDAQWHQLRLNRISQALITGVYDPAVLADAYPYPELVLRDIGYMKRNRLSIFAGKQYSQLGRPLNSVYRLAPSNDCSGYISSSKSFPADAGQGLRLTGFAWDAVLKAPVRDIVAVADGKIAGFGSSVTVAQGVKNVTAKADPARFGWITFVQPTGRSRVELYAAVGGGRTTLCRFSDVAP